MSEQSILFTESPASWNTKYITPDGFECQLTLRADNGQDLIEKANNAMVYLIKSGYKPFTYTRGRKSNGNKAKSVETDQKCPIHDVPMRKFEKDGRVWFSHKADDGWCSGKQG